MTAFQCCGDVTTCNPGLEHLRLLVLRICMWDFVQEEVSYAILALG